MFLSRFLSEQKRGLVDPFVFVMCRMYHCHLNAAPDNGGPREIDGTRRRNRNQSHSLQPVMEEVTTSGPSGGQIKTYVRT